MTDVHIHIEKGPYTKEWIDPWTYFLLLVVPLNKQGFNIQSLNPCSFSSVVVLYGEISGKGP